MVEGIYPLSNVYPELLEETPGEPGDKYFVIHSHIGSDFDRAVIESQEERVFKGLEGAPEKLLIRHRYFLDSTEHDVVKGNEPGLNQAMDIVCQIYVS